MEVNYYQSLIFRSRLWLRHICKCDQYVKIYGTIIPVTSAPIPISALPILCANIFVEWKHDTKLSHKDADFD